MGGGGGGEDLIGGRDDGLGGGGAKWLIRCRFSRVIGELWEDFPNSLPFFLDFHCDMFLVSQERRIGECGRMLIDESVEVWERLRLGTYSKEGLLSESK